MRKTLMGCMVVLSFAAMVSGGCAKKEVIKAEEPIAAVKAAPTTTKPESGNYEYRPETKLEQPRAAQPMTETPTTEAAIKQESPRESVSPQAANLENELQKIYFNFDSATLSDQARSALSKDAELLAKQPAVKLRIEGNCDERGSDEYNMALGERRAKAARDYLVNLGVSAERLSTISYGEEKPVDPGHSEEAWAKNRRDEFVIVK